MAHNDRFFFVNSSDQSHPESKAITNARAFVMRKCRAEKPWSTRKGHKNSRKDWSALAKRPEAVSPVGRSIEGVLGSECGCNSRLHGCSACFHTGQENPGRYVGQRCAGCSGSHPEPQTILDGPLDPFRSTAVLLDRDSTLLIDFCTLY